MSGPKKEKKKVSEKVHVPGTAHCYKLVSFTISGKLVTK